MARRHRWRREGGSSGSRVQRRACLPDGRGPTGAPGAGRRSPWGAAGRRPFAAIARRGSLRDAFARSSAKPRVATDRLRGWPLQCRSVEPPLAFRVKAHLRALIQQGIDALRAHGTLPADAATPDFVVERPKDRSHGDFSTNAAMLLAKAAKSNPRAIAQALLPQLEAADTGGLLAAIEIAGPGFLNFRLAPAAWQAQLRDIHAQGAAYGRNDSGRGHRAGVEYVS